MAQPCFHSYQEPAASLREGSLIAPPSYDAHVLPSTDEIQKELPGCVLASGPSKAIAGLKSSTLGPIKSVGNLNYVIVLDRPVREAQVWGEWKGSKSLLTDFSEGGRPKLNYLVWHLDLGENAEAFTIELKGLAEHEEVTWALYTLSAHASVGKKSSAWGGAPKKGPDRLTTIGNLWGSAFSR